VGAIGDEHIDGTGRGSACVFIDGNGSWSQQAKLTIDGRDGIYSVALSGDGTSALVGTPFAEGSNDPATGEAHVFDTAGSSWSRHATLTADDGDSNDQFGKSVALSSDATTALIGADTDVEEGSSEDNNITGSAYVFSI